MLSAVLVLLSLASCPALLSAADPLEAGSERTQVTGDARNQERELQQHCDRWQVDSHLYKSKKC